MITPITLLDAHDPRDVHKHKQNDQATPQNFFRAPQTPRMDSLPSSFWSPKAVLGSKMGIKTKKWVWFDVCANKKWLGRRTTTPIALLNAHDVEDVCKNIVVAKLF